MCEFCTKHGDGKVWYRNAANYAQDLLSDLKRRKYIEGFLRTTIDEGFRTLGRLETIFRRKGRLPDPVVKAMVERAKTEHFGQVLPIEEIRDLVLQSRTVVRMPCACRWATKGKEERCCYGISYGPDPWYKDIDMAYFGMAHDEGLESLAPEEAVVQMDSLEDHGAVHTIWTMMTPFIGAVCNCSLEDCLAMRTLAGIGVETMARAEQAAAVNAELCDGCGLCAPQCQFGAIESVQEQGSFKAVVLADRCFGCGLCRRHCPTGAMTLVQRA